MKKVKAMALVLAVAMISGVLAGCSKTTTIGTDKFTKVCEKLKLEEFELDGDSPDMDDLEDGIISRTIPSSSKISLSRSGSMTLSTLMTLSLSLLQLSAQVLRMQRT